MIAIVVAASVAACAFQTSPIPDERNDVFDYALVAPVPLSQAIRSARRRIAHADLFRADLKLARLQNANLRGVHATNLAGATLAGANLEGANSNG